MITLEEYERDFAGKFGRKAEPRELRRHYGFAAVKRPAVGCVAVLMSVLVLIGTTVFNLFFEGG